MSSSNPLAGMSNIQFNISNTDLSSIFIADLRAQHAAEIVSKREKIDEMQRRAMALSAKTVEDVNKWPEVLEYVGKVRKLIKIVRDIDPEPAIDIDLDSAPIILVTLLLQKGSPEEDEEEEDNQIFRYSTPTIVGEGKKRKTTLYPVIVDSKGKMTTVKNICYAIGNRVLQFQTIIGSDGAITRLNRDMAKLEQEIEDLEYFDYEEIERKLVSQMTRTVLASSPDLLLQLNTIYKSTVLQLTEE